MLKKPIHFAISIALLGISHAQAISMPEELCKFDSKTGLFVDFDKSRKNIFMDFAPHRSANELTLLEDMISHPEIYNPEAIVELGPALDRLEAKLKLSKELEQAQRLHKFVTNGEINWIGIEYSPMEISRRDSQGRTLSDRFQILSTLLEARGASKSTLERTLLLYAGSSTIYAWLKYPELRQRTKQVSLESNSLKKQAIDALNNSEFLFTIVEEAAKTPELRKKLQAIHDAYEKNIAPRTLIPDQEIRDLVKDTIDPSWIQMVTLYLKSERDFIRVQNARDQFEANTADDQKGNGFLALGTDHQIINQTLTNACVARMNKRQGKVTEHVNTGEAASPEGSAE